ncbi:hypothetical protein ElyMa_007041600 [Elysia marginata]|uniref:Uncharacterized protein n=1 Tax=Elysia marginata TaxID=1093978 RepID=A0AAV4JWF1_9GAST|nr:hypothetical protein ElyMa_007041600 [Elysia marginata]
MATTEREKITRKTDLCKDGEIISCSGKEPSGDEMPDSENDGRTVRRATFCLGKKASESGCRREGTFETQLSTTLTTPRLTSPRELQFSLRPAVRPRLPSPISVTARSTGSKVTNFTTAS